MESIWSEKSKLVLKQFVVGSSKFSPNKTLTKTQKFAENLEACMKLLKHGPLLVDGTPVVYRDPIPANV